jgi:hypothetical protein
MRDWIVVQGSLLSSAGGGGFEFFGPFTEEEAVEVRDELRTEGHNNDHQIMCVQLRKVT